MLGLRQMLTFTMSSIIIFWAQINQKIFYAGEILIILSICLVQVLLMMERYIVFVIDSLL